MVNKNEFLGTIIPISDHEYGAKRKIFALADNVAQHVLSLKKIRERYGQIPECRDPFEFLEQALRVLKVDYKVGDRHRDAIPKTGPLIMVSNHPFGGIDGIILAHFLSSIRRDFKILVNYFLHAISELRPLFLAVDPFGAKASSWKNISSMSKAVRWVKSGGMLVVFPAGEVSHLSWRKLRVLDPEWSVTIARLIRLTNAPVIPVYFKGRNSDLFQIAGLAHPLLRTAMLPREMIKRERSEIQFKVGSLIPYRVMDTFTDSSDLTEYIRFRTYLLGAGFRNDGNRMSFLRIRNGDQRAVQAIAPAQDIDALDSEVKSLPYCQKLYNINDFSVYYARAGQIQKILQEIGRLRETTFRLIGEGTGRSIDIDRFDNIYIHLFVWNNRKKEIVGAYRLGPTDEILPRHGKKGLYTHTLFKYRPEFLDDLVPSLELGRTFVRAEYQKNYASLLLLWKGIGQYIVLNPRYKVLFGAVSISNDYHSYSRQLIVNFLKMNRFCPDFSKMVKPRKGFREINITGFNHTTAKAWRNNVDELSTWISTIEDDGKGVPILIKQYLKLGGRFLCFNLDYGFGKTLDGLILLDLTRADHKMLKHYMGIEGFNSFKKYHSEKGLEFIPLEDGLPLQDYGTM
jgi:putative hemolysin